jgi:ribose transport system permease protein
MKTETDPVLTKPYRGEVTSEPRQTRGTAHAVRRTLLAKRFGGIWILLALVVFFGLKVPGTFLTPLTLQTTLADGAITGFLALGIMLPLITGVFDLSIAGVAGFSMVLSSYLTQHHEVGTVGACLIALVLATLFGLLSAFFVTRLRLNSLITTLGVNSVALGLTELIAGGNDITANFSSWMNTLGQGRVLGIPLPFVYVLVAAGAMYYLLEHTPLGRRLQATGGNPEAARLAGIRVRRLQAGVLLASAFMGGFAGLVLAAQIGVATDSTAEALLLPAAAAVFLGATQIKEGVNPWGTVLGVLILGTGIKGLELLGAQPWVQDFFDGAVLLVAVAVSGKGIERLH